MASYNRVVLVGNLTRDPELRYIPSGTAVTEVGLAVNDRRKNAAGEWIDETTFIDITLWGRQAEIASEYLSKGSSVLIEGRLKLRYLEPVSEVILDRDRPGLILPQQPHEVEPLGPMRMQVDFYDQPPPDMPAD